MFALEFSFDRSKDAQPPKAEQEATGPRPGPDLNTVDPSTIANERLRKAIERNRAKQVEREAQAPSSPPPRPTQVRASTGTPHEQNSFFNQTETAKENTRETTREATRETPSEAPPRSTSMIRRSVAKPEDTEFVPVKRSTRKVASQINYTTTTSRKKSKPIDPKYLSYLVKGSWIFCGILILRLIFAAGGVTDYYAQKASVNARVSELVAIKKENMQLVQEIERMRSDIGFQKKLVRDNLGFIASDEFLVLFPKEN